MVLFQIQYDRCHFSISRLPTILLKPQRCTLYCGEPTKGCLPYSQKSGNFGLRSNGTWQFFGKSFRKLWTTSRGSPLFSFGMEFGKCPYHLPESFHFQALSHTDRVNMDGMPSSKMVSAILMRLVIKFGKLLTSCNYPSIRFIWLNGKHTNIPM